MLVELGHVFEKFLVFGLDEYFGSIEIGPVVVAVWARKAILRIEGDVEVA